MLTLSTFVEKLKEELTQKKGTELPDFVVTNTLRSLDPTFENIEYRNGKLFKIIEISSPELKI